MVRNNGKQKFKEVKCHSKKGKRISSGQDKNYDARLPYNGELMMSFLTRA